MGKKVNVLILIILLLSQTILNPLAASQTALANTLDEPAEQAISVEDLVDITDLEEILKEIEKLSEAEYEATVFDKFKKEVEHAEQLLSNEQATQLDIDKMVERLEEQLLALEKSKETSVDTPKDEEDSPGKEEDSDQKNQEVIDEAEVDAEDEQDSEETPVTEDTEKTDNDEKANDEKSESKETDEVTSDKETESDQEETIEDENRAYDEAKAAVEKAIKTNKKKDIQAANDLIDALEDTDQQTELRERLPKLEKPKKKNNVQVLNDDPDKDYFHLTSSTLTDLSGAKFDENNPFNPDGEFKLTVDWELDDHHGWGNEKEITIVLPEQIKYDAGTEIPLYDSTGELVATVKLSDSNIATLVFTDYITDANEVSGQFQIIAKIDQDKVKEEDGYIIIDGVGEEGSHKIPISMIDRKKDVQKQGVPNKQYESEYIDWTVTVNSERVSLKDAKITDTLPAGTEYVEGSLKVYEQKTSVNGKPIGDPIPVDELTSSTENGEISVEFGNIHTQYIVEYRTKITDEDGKEFKNNVTLTTEGDPDTTADATVEITRGEPLTKQSTADFDPVNGTVSWKIEFNYNQKDLTAEGGVTLEDTWTVSPFREMVLDGDITFTEMEIDGDGNATPKAGGTAPTHGSVVPKLNEDGKQIGFEILGIQTDKPYEITYTTKIEGRILETLEISNMAGFGPHETPGVGPGEIGRYYGIKKPGKIDYAAKMIPWTIQLNQDQYPMGNIRIEDTLGPGLSLVDNSFEIKVGGQPYTGAAPTVTKNGQKFILNFPTDFVTEEIVDITYQTTFVPDEVIANTPTNNATIYWTPGASGTEQSGDVSAKTEFREEVGDYSWKNASYNAETKEITWEIIANYRENEFTNLRIEDELQGDEVLEPYDFEIHELIIAENGDYTEGDPFQSVNPNITGKKFSLEIGPTSKAYKITYKTSLANLSEITKQYINKATVFDGNTEVNKDLIATAGIYEDQKYANKSGSQENNSKFADWKILVNLAQEKIVDLQLKDTASSNQEYLPHTIKVYETKFVDGQPVKDEDKPLDSSKYEVTVNEAATPEDTPSFELKWLAEVDRPYIVEYSTIFFAGHGGEITNSYEITGNNKLLSGEDENTGSSIKIRQTASGSATGKAGRLIVKKKDTSYDFTTGNQKDAVLEGIQFEVQDLSGKKIKEGTTDANGKIDFGRLLYGDYKLVEIKKSMKPGYIAPELEKTIKINKDYSDVEADHTVEFENYEAIFAVELTKVDSVHSNRKLAGAEFGIYRSETDANPIMTATTDADGYILFNLAEAQPPVKEKGTYYVKEITSPDKYQENNKVYPVKINDKEREPKQLGDIKNTLYPGKGELRKVDSLKTNGDQDDLVGLSGAEFGVYNTDDKKVSEFTTNAQGIGTTEDLPPGTYTVKEITAPTGFTASTETFYLTIPEANSIVTYPITAQGESTRVDVKNTVKHTNIEVTKQDLENANQKIEGVTFEIVDYDKEAYDGRYNQIINDYIADDTKKKAVTNSSGVATFEDLPPGKYKLKESEVPSEYGFIPDNGEFEVEVTYEDVNGEATPVTTTRTNKPLAKVTLKKVDRESAYNLSGVEFTLWKDDEQITNHYGRTDFTTDTNGEITITGLLPGAYELREVEPPTGYKKADGNGSIRSFTVPELSSLTSSNETEMINFTSTDNNGAVKNDIVKGSITISKVDGDKETNNALAGVEFTIKAKSLEKVNDDGYLDTYNTENQTNFKKLTNEKGEVTFENLRPGIYEIKETKGLEGYQSYWGTIPDTKVNLQDEAHEVKLENDKAIKNYKKRTLTVTKKWEDLDENLRPDEITVELVRKVDNGDFTSLNPPKELTIKKSGGWTGAFTDLDAVNGDGEEYIYSVQEVTPEGYTSEVAETVVDETVKEKQSVELTNTAKETKIELTKKDSISGELINGAKFELTDSKGNTTEHTTVDGKLSIQNLQPGTYKLKEKEAAPGYILNSKEKTITITNADVEANVTKKVEFENDPLAKVMILKQDVDTKTALKGAEFKITGDNDFEKTVITGEDGQVIVTGLPAGEYTIEEITPPSGYSKHNNDNDKRTFAVQANATTTIDHDFTAADGELHEGSFKNSIILGSVKLLKQNNSSEPMENVEFTLKATELNFAAADYVTTYNENLANPYQTGSNGELEINNLRPGKYTLSELIPDGYQEDYVGNDKDLGDKKGTFEFTIEPAGENALSATEVGLGTVINYALTKIEVSKVWKDENPSDRVITDQKIYLERNIAGGTKEIVQSVELENTDKTYTFENLPVVDKDGETYKYSVREDAVPGYATSIDGFTITNTRSENITISGEKTWEYGEGGAQYMPDEITVQLLANGLPVEGKVATIEKDKSQEYQFENLPRFDKVGKEIKYTVKESEVPGFTPSYTVDEADKTKMNITNKQEIINISGKKTWKDEDPSSRPEKITVQVLIKGKKTVVAEQEIGTASNETYAFKNLPKYDKSGEEIKYVINELSVPGYEATIAGSNITNTRTDKTDISVTKKWLDEDESDRPKSITVQLYQNGNKYGDKVEIKPKDNEWSYTFEALEQFDADGKAFAYTIEEVSLDDTDNKDKNYTQKGGPIWIAEDNGFTITNVRTGTKKVEGTKTWLDENNPDRLKSIEIEVYRSVEGDETPTKFKTETIDSPDWVYSFDYPAFNEDGKKYTYSVKEVVPEGYELKAQDGFDFTNVRVGTTDITVTKDWKHKNAKDLPTEIEVDLFRSTQKGDKERVNDKEKPYQLTADDWTLTIHELPEFDEIGNKYTYELKERTVAEYNSKVDESGLHITNTRKTYAIGDYVWSDRNKDGVQDKTEAPLEGVTVELYDKDGKTVIATTTTDENGRYIFDELVSGDYKVKFTLTDEQAKQYKFTKQNADKDSIKNSDANENGWTKEILLKENNKQLTKDYEDQTFKASEGIDPTWDAGVIELVDISGVKTWKDDNDDEAIAARPQSITVQLLADDTKVDTQPVKGPDWTYSFEDLDKYGADGNEIVYTIDEEKVEGYEKSIDGFNLTNTRTGTTQVKVTKAWLDAVETERPEKVTVELYQNDDKEVFKTEVITADEDWTYTFEDLPKYDTEGKIIEYTVKEINLDDKYKQQSITGDAKDGFTITNIRTDETSVTISKKWKDDENATKQRPDKILVNLHRSDGVTEVHEVTAEKNWNLTIDKLPAFDNEGKPYTYTISEHDVPGYDSKVNEFDITNTRSDKKDITITKTWLVDESENHPEEIKVDLFRSIPKGDKEPVDTYTVTAAKDWELIIEDLPSFDDNGKAYTYTIEEHSVDGYETTINGFDITNLRVGTTEVSGEKKWVEVDERYRPDKVTIQLLANGKAKDTTEVSADTDWKYEFANLAKYDDKGKLITYTVEEIDVPQGYESEIKGFDITNTQETTDVTGTKTWVDHGDVPRPAKITVQLKKGDKVIKEQELASDETTFTFDDLPKYDKAGKLITYTVDEKVVSEYNKSINGTDITNTRKTYAIGDYVWIDRNKNGIQDKNEDPLADVKVELYDKDGKTVIATTTTDANGKYIFDELVSGDYQVKFTLTEEQAKQYKFTKQNAGKDSTNDSDADKNGWTINISLNENNEQLTKSYKDVKASEGIDPTWDAGVIELVDVSGTKTWKDDNSKDRPTEITVQLLANNKEVDTAKVIGPDWNYAFNKLDKYDTNGKEITYTIDEKAIEGYEKSIVGYDLTNVRIGQTAVNVEKVWKDDSKSNRPAKITVNLLANGTFDSQHDVTAKDDWKLTIADLEKYDTDGKEIVYTISEQEVMGYALESIEGNAKQGLKVTNRRAANKSIPIVKHWIGDEGMERPELITVELFRSIADEKKESVGTYTVKADNDWELTIDNLPAFDSNGQAYTYEVEEETIAEYNQSVHGFDIINTRKTYAIGDYVWIDRNKNGIQDKNEDPLAGVKVELYDKDGKTVIATTTTDKNGHYIFDELVSGDYKVKFTLTDEQAKEYKFTKQDVGKDGSTDSDADKNGWTKEISLHDQNKQLTKDYKDQTFKASEGIDPTWDAGVIELVNLPIKKIWNDRDESIRPDAITVHVLANGEAVKDYTVTAKDGWVLTIGGLDKYDTNGKEIIYSITENTVSEYRSSVDQFEITNTRKTYAISDYVWIDRNKDGIQDDNEERLEGVLVELFDKDGNRIAQTTTNKDGLYIFDNLESGDYQVKFTLTKEQAKKYKFTKQGVGDDATNDSKANENGWTITIQLNESNKHLTTDYEDQDFNASEGIDPTWDAGVIELVDITVNKVWKDNDESTRPESITIDLFANGEKVSKHTLTAKDKWMLMITGLDKHDTDGKEIEYTIVEQEVLGYESEITAKETIFTVTNTFIDQPVVDKTEDPKPEKPDKPEKPTLGQPEGQRPEDNKPSEPNKKAEGTLPNTATSTYNFLFVGIAFFLFGSVALLARKRKRK